MGRYISRSVKPRLKMGTLFLSFVYTQVVITFCIYVYTAFPSISGGDAGELAAIACTGGIAHPPGYPLWIMMARSTLWITDVVGFDFDVAYRLNIMSAALSSIAAGVLMSTIKALSCSIFKLDGFQTTMDSNHMNTATMYGSMVSTALYSFSGGIWEFSTQAEVFALNNLLIALLIRAQFSALVAASHYRNQTKTELLAQAESDVIFQTSILALISGLCLTNQHTSVVYVAIAALGVMYAGRGVWMKGGFMPCLKALSCYSVSALVGLSPYLYLPITARSKPLDSWGDQRSVQGFLTHFLRKEYGTFKLASELGEQQDIGKFVARFKVFFLRFSEDSLTVVGPCFALLGISLIFWSSYKHLALETEGNQTKSISKMKKNKNKITPSPSVVASRLYDGCGMLLLVQVTCYSVLINSLANLSFSELHLNITARMWQQAFYVGFILVGVGFSRLTLLLLTLVDKDTTSKSTTGVILAALMVLASMQVSQFWDRNDQHTNDLFVTYGRQVVDGLPLNALLLVNDDMNCNLPQYVLRCENKRFLLPSHTSLHVCFTLFLNLRPDVQLVRLPLITYPWWRPMQIHHYTHLNTSETTRKGKVLLGRDGWHVFGSVDEELNDIHVNEMKSKYENGNHSISKKKRKVGELNRTLSLAYPGLKHHPYEKQLVGSFSLDEFLHANLKHRAVFVAGEWKPGDDSGNKFQRVPCGLVERVLGPKEPLDLLILINEGVFLLPTEVPAPLSALLLTPVLDKGAWDYIIGLKYYRGIFTAAQLLAEQMSKLPPPTSLPISPHRSVNGDSMLVDFKSPNRITMLRTASRAYTLLSELCSSNSESDFYCAPGLWRNAGIVSSYLASDLSSIGGGRSSVKEEEEEAAQLMFKYWAKYVDEAPGEGLDLIQGMKAGINPVNQKTYSRPSWFKAWVQNK